MYIRPILYRLNLSRAKEAPQGSCASQDVDCRYEPSICRGYGRGCSVVAASAVSTAPAMAAPRLDERAPPAGVTLPPCRHWG